MEPICVLDAGQRVTRRCLLTSPARLPARPKGSTEDRWIVIGSDKEALRSEHEIVRRQIVRLDVPEH